MTWITTDNASVSRFLRLYSFGETEKQNSPEHIVLPLDPCDARARFRALADRSPLAAGPLERFWDVDEHYFGGRGRNKSMSLTLKVRDFGIPLDFTQTTLAGWPRSNFALYSGRYMVMKIR